MSENTPRHDHPPSKAGKTPLPRWDLSHLFSSDSAAEFQQTMTFIETEGAEFARKYQGRVIKLSGAQLGTAIATYEKISEAAGRLEAYAMLSRAADHGKAAFAEGVSERVRQAEKNILFFTLEINKMKEADLLDKIAAPELAQYGSWLRRVRAQKDHQLEEDVEHYVHLKSAVAEKSWVRLFELTKSELRFSAGGKEMTEAEAINVIHNADDPALRRAAYAEFGRVLGENGKTFSRIFNTLADLKSVRDNWRSFENPEDSRHLANQIEPEVVNAMVRAVRESYPRTAHRYYAWKAKKFGVSRLHPADRNAPLPGAKAKAYDFDEAKDIVLSAFSKFSQDFSTAAKNIFSEDRIDAEPRPGKDSGAFSHPVSPGTGPYISLNFFGAPRDVQVLAHELGHGVHQTLAAKQGYLKSATPLTLAETASVFGEMLAFREMLDREEDLAARRTMIAGKVESMLNTVTRQVAFYTFEQRLHQERSDKGELAQARISEIWQETQKESLGPAVNLDTPGAENLWMHVPHFVHSPFYVYAYAFGDCLVNALYDEYTKSGDKPAFAEKYMTLLSAGGTQRPDAALAEFGLDTADPKFWKKGLSVIERYIDELIVLDQKIEQTAKTSAPKGLPHEQAGQEIVGRDEFFRAATLGYCQSLPRA